MIKRLVITEGEIDSLILRQLGYVAVTSTTGANTFRSEWAEHFANVEELYICLDNDKVGKHAAIELASKLRNSEPKIVAIPETQGVKDINEYFLSGKTKDDFDNLLATAVKYDPDKIEFINLEISEIPTDFTPAQHFVDDVAMVSVKLPIKSNADVEENWYVVTSDKHIYPLMDFLSKFKFNLRKNPDYDLRWSKDSLQNFLKGREPYKPLEAFDNTLEFLKKYISFETESLYLVIGLWIWATYFHRMFRSFPYLNVTGLMNTGKTKLLEVCASLSFNGDLLMGSTPAFIIRSINDNSSTVCLDEAEKLKNSDNAEVQTLVFMLNTGYRSGTYVGKMEAKEKGKGWKTKKFDPYSPKIVCGINTVAETLVSRSINVTMLPSSNVEIRNREVDLGDSTIQLLRDQYYLSIMHSFKEVKEVYDNLTDLQIIGRNWQIWRPLLSLAVVIDSYKGDEGGAIYNSLRDYALEKIRISSSISEDSQNVVQLLLILKNIMQSENKQEAFYPVANLKSILTTEYQDEFSWIKDGSFNRYLGPLLRKAGVIVAASESKMINGKLCRGYTLKLSEIERRLNGLGVGTE